MEQVILGGNVLTPDTAAVRYACLSGGGGWTATESNTHQLVTTPGDIKYLRVKLTVAPGGAASYTFTLRVNGANTALTCTITGAATSNSDMVNSVAVAAGDYVDLMCTPAGGPAASKPLYTTVFEGDNAAESLILGCSPDNLNSGATEYIVPSAGISYWSGTENNRRVVIPTDGTIKNLYVKLTASPGVNPDAYRFTLRLNGANTALTCTITDPATTANDIVNTVNVSAGDYISLQCEPLNGPANTPDASWGMTFVADTDGESLILNSTSDDLDDTLTEYMYLLGEYGTWTNTENDREQLGQACTIYNLYVLLSGSPGAGNTYTFTFRQNNGATTLTVPIADAATSGNDTVHSVTISNDDELALQVVPDDTPDVRDAYWGLVCYIAPPPGNPGGNIANKMIGAGLL